MLSSDLNFYVFFRKSLVNDNVLSIPDMESGDFGEYVCQAQNDYGQAELVFLVESGRKIFIN